MLCIYTQIISSSSKEDSNSDVNIFVPLSISHHPGKVINHLVPRSPNLKEQIHTELSSHEHLTKFRTIDN